MSDFEKLYKIDPAREAEIEIESPSIELSDEEMRDRRIRYDAAMKELKALRESKSSEKEENDAQGASKSPKGKPKKNDPKSHKAAVEGL